MNEGIKGRINGWKRRKKEYTIYLRVQGRNNELAKREMRIVKYVNMHSTEFTHL